MVVRRQAVSGKKAHLRLPSMVQKRCMLKLSNVEEKKNKTTLTIAKENEKLRLNIHFKKLLYIIILSELDVQVSTYTFSD